jgi:hypothetical protein
MEEDLLVLHGLAVKKSGTAEQVARLLGQPEAEVSATFGALVSSGEVAGAKGLYMPTPAGRNRLDAAYPALFAKIRADESFACAFERFEAINRHLLALITRWQTISRAGTSVPNDHLDPGYDAKVLDELGDTHDRVQPVLGAFARPAVRFSAYSQRLDEAFERALTGEHDYVSGVRVDSYHTVWHELHEDLLRTLGRSRKE